MQRSVLVDTVEKEEGGQAVHVFPTVRLGVEYLLVIEEGLEPLRLVTESEAVRVPDIRNPGIEQKARTPTQIDLTIGFPQTPHIPCTNSWSWSQS